MQIKSHFAILIGLTLVFSCRCLTLSERQMPIPDLTFLKDDIGTLPQSGDYMPAVMQCLHYYTEMMQYELLPNNSTTQKPQATTKRPVATTKKPIATTKKPVITTTTTTQKPVTTTQKPVTTTKKHSVTTRKTTPRSTTKKPMKSTTKTSTILQDQTTNKYPYSTEINIWHNPITARPHEEPVTIIHKPGYFAPERPPYWTYFGIPMKPEQGFHRPAVQQPQVGIDTLSDPNWKDPAFIQWFFQPKPKEVELFDEDELQLLDPLPKKLLLDLHHESNRLPALLDIDNVNEFRKKYDDSYYPRYRNQSPNMQQMRMKMKIQMQQQRQMLTGRKKPPPTRPYVHMLMLYDLLKREAKSKKLHQFGGFTQELLHDLDFSSQKTGDYQLKYLMEKMLDRKEVTSADVLSKVKFIISDIDDVKGVTYKTLRMIPPLVFSP